MTAITLWVITAVLAAVGVAAGLAIEHFKDE